MAEMRMAEVEGFKLTKEQLAWVKEYKRVNMIGEQLASGMQIKYGELEQMQELSGQVAGRKKELLQMAPVKGVKELPGQDGEQKSSAEKKYEGFMEAQGREDERRIHELSPGKQRNIRQIQRNRSRDGGIYGGS